jgi:excisionase family DNA binding protein
MIRHLPPTFAETRKAVHQMKSDFPIEPEALSVEEFCVFSRLGKTKVYELIAAGTLKTRRCGRRRLILRADGRACLQSLPTE